MSCYTLKVMMWVVFNGHASFTGLVYSIGEHNCLVIGAPVVRNRRFRRVTDARAWLEEERIKVVMRNERAAEMARSAREYMREVDANKRKRCLERKGRKEY